jgi:hypothetical protein
MKVLEKRGGASTLSSDASVSAVARDPTTLHFQQPIEVARITSIEARNHTDDY